MNKAFIKYFLAAIIFTGGAVVFLYPAISTFVNEQSQTSVVQEYQVAAAALDENTIKISLEEAKAYNESLLSGQGELTDPFGESTSQGPRVYSFLNVGDVMGSIEIPKIGTQSPIYEGTSEEVLQKGIGWLTGTSLPVGGPSTHTVLSGHRGLPTSRLFTDLDKLEVGDEFYIRNLSEILAYKVTEIQIVEPSDSSALNIVEGEDKATLLTCHPYMVNSHRLLVTGDRVPYTGQLDEKTDLGFFENLTPVERNFILAMAVIGASLILLIVIIVRTLKKRERDSVFNGKD